MDKKHIKTILSGTDKRFINYIGMERKLIKKHTEEVPKQYVNKTKKFNSLKDLEFDFEEN